MPSVLLAGLPWNHYTSPIAEGVRDGLAFLEKAMVAAGYDYTFVPVTPEDGVRDLTGELTSKKFDLLVIGNGVRSKGENTPFFEKLINTSFEVSPSTKIAFNTSPASTIEAAQRWFPVSK